MSRKLNTFKKYIIYDKRILFVKMYKYMYNETAYNEIFNIYCTIFF